ncbi:LysR family transcriptional regulator [Cupriavidus taiwanensis]|uniref:LysR family transcriptional regulator n=1 Tax=Cupriavidus taiwanensis TaxID=164546 RepID=A0A976AG39_9BURK|nr:LysR family transcriptional regulator [Cupriavidus taiwanensis]SOY79525.1 LysR family transcriptional regulator [Cupriavidus taiwanensis]SOY81498.1 LysR family transcriptional regulator [Cupriavidus taiwanensis]SPD64744.1 LysR family transcriptional regulator [Cupriavidus taiwanensis]
MDLKQIQYFIALFEDGSVTRAAKRLNIVQPALSMQIARLEEEFGQKLFDRIPHGMVPTAAGRMMYRLFLPIVRDIAGARQQMMMREEQMAGRITLGMVASETESVLVGSLARFNARYPNVEVSVADGFSAALIDLVSAGQLDAAVVHRQRGRPALHVQPLHDEEMVLVTSVAHGPELPESVEMAKLPGLDLVLPTKRHGLRVVLDTATQAQDVTLAPKFEIDILGTIVQFVQATRFATVLPRIVVLRAVEEGRLRMHTIIAPRIVRHLVCVSHPQRPLSTAAEALIAIVAEEIRRVCGVA